ncbi:MAG: tetratricopeptide repeat protein [Deltaproteobacteria bacterium]|nr:tetratricopeptide repeat protein [Deltaproteobacteria bacterium]
MLRASVGFIAACFALGCGRPEVTRIYAGRTHEERFIGDAAYREFTAASELEARGDLARARDAYRRVLDHDAESIEAWTRLGEVECRLTGEQGASSAEASFLRAERLDATYAPLWRARADCARARGLRDLVAVERAFRLDPGEDRLALEFVDALLASRQNDAAFALSRELVARSPGSLDGWRTMNRVASVLGEAAWQRESERRVRSLMRAGRTSPVEPRGGVDFTAVFEDLVLCLATNEDARARAMATAHRLGSEEFAAVALLAGRPDLALSVALRVLAADPRAGDMRLLGALAARRLGDDARAAGWMAEHRGDVSAGVGPLGGAALRELGRARPSSDGVTPTVPEPAPPVPSNGPMNHARWLAAKLSHFPRETGVQSLAP